MIEYTWKVLGLKTQSVGSNQNVVVQVSWEKTGTVDGVSASFRGDSDFNISYVPESYNFVPFNQLTEADIIDWVKNSIIFEYGVEMDKQIAAQINSINNPIVDATLPWQTTNQYGNYN